MSILFSSLQIKNIKFKNRLVVSPMCMYSSVDGFANDFHLVHLGSRAIGGAALIMQEATAISAEGRITNSDLGIWKDEHIIKLQQIVKFIHSQNALAGIQLAHAGRKASCELPWMGGKQIPSNDQNGWKVYAPSAIPFKAGTELPITLNRAVILKIKDDYIAATKRAKIIGYDVLEIHAAHGYLLHEFYSPMSNLRDDEYGGSFENRTRLLLEVTELVQQEWGKDKPLFVRISATDWIEGGWTIDDSVMLAKLLKQRGVDLIDTSSGGNDPNVKNIPVGPGYQVNLAAQIKKEAEIMTGAVGMITTAQQAESILEKDEADLIFIARENLRQPYFALHAAHDLNEDISWPVQYERAKIK